jgi:FkbM family methyltransferase
MTGARQGGVVVNTGIGKWNVAMVGENNRGSLMRPTARARRNLILQTAAQLCRQYLKWFGNASYKPARNGEQWLLSRLRDEPVRTVLDVGANVGNWSLMAAQLLPEAAIYALEIVPATAAELRSRVAGERRIRPFNLGLAEHNGTLALNYHPAASTHATFTDYPHSWTGERVECPVMRGDDFLTREGIGQVDFLKLDVEGAEHLALQGFEAALRQQRIRLVQFEYGRVNVLTHFLLRDFYRLFSQYGYAVGKIYPDYVDFRDYELADEDFLGPNYLACRNDDGIRRRLEGKLQV